MSWRLPALNFWLRLHEKPRLARMTDAPRARARLEAVSRLLSPPPLAARAASLGGVPALRIPGGPPVILWLHGGAYCLGSPRTHAAMAGALARRAGAGAVLPDYRLAPEHPFPAAIDDTVAAYRALAAETDGPIVIGGDSAGGGLALALLHEILRGGLPRPACLVAFSPWTDLTGSGESLGTLASLDALLPAERLPEIAAAYLGGADPRDPRASPLFGGFEGAPPVLIQASASEILRDDATRMADRLRADGAPVTLELDDAVPHVWQLFHNWLPEASAALDRAAAFIAQSASR